MNRKIESWWTRPCGGKEVLALALPLMISTGSWSLMLFVDRMLLLWHSPEAIAAALPAGCLYFTTSCFGLGTAGYVSTFVAQYYGAGEQKRIGMVVWQGMWIGLLSLPLFLLLIPLAPLVFAWAGHAEEVARQETIYYRILLWSAGANVISAAQAGFFSGRGQTRVIMIVDVTTVLLNVALDALLILGLFGFPRWGIAGAGWATVISIWAKVFAYSWLMCRKDCWHEYSLGSTWALDPALLKRLFVYGAPSGLQLLVEAGSFTLLALRMGRYGTLAMTASTLALNVNAVAVIPMVGLSIATSVAVGQQLTRGRSDLAVRATWSSLAICLVYTMGFASLYLLVPDLLLNAHAAGIRSSEFAEIRALTIGLLRFVAVFCVLDGLQMVFAGAIKGAGDTWFIFRATMVISALAVAICWQETSWGLMWWWSVITAWVGALFVVFSARFLGGKWKQMRVIETEFVELERSAVEAV